MTCFIIQKSISISKNAKLNKYLVTVTRVQVVQFCIVNLWWVLLEEQAEEYVVDISKL